MSAPERGNPDEIWRLFSNLEKDDELANNVDVAAVLMRMGLKIEVVCVDTTFLAGLIRKDPETNKKLLGLVKERSSISTIVVNCAELFYGAYESTYVDKGKRRLGLFLVAF